MGVLNIVNLAHGGFIDAQRPSCPGISTLMPVSTHFVGAASTAVVMFAIGYAVQRGLLNLIVRAPMLNTLLITFGLEVRYLPTSSRSCVFLHRLSHH